MLDGYWYPTDLPFLDFPTVFGCSFFRDPLDRPLRLGEVFVPTPPFSTLEKKDGLDGEHICGSPEVFLEGGAWPNHNPPVEYNDQDIPLCCKPANVSQVKAGARPSAKVEVSPFYGGRAKSAPRPAAQVAFGRAGATRAQAAARPGALVRADGPWLGRPKAGARPHALVEVIPPLRVKAGASPGALVELIPPGPSPGPTCSTAAVTTIGAPNAATIPADGTHWWFLGAVTSGALFHLDQTGWTGERSSQVGLWFGPDCSDLIPGGWVDPFEPCQTFNAPLTADLWIRWRNFDAAPKPYTFTVGAGGC